MSIPALRMKVQSQCKHCELWMGENHNFEDCYKESKGFSLICSQELQEKYPLDYIAYNKYSQELQEGTNGNNK
jgi:hypothetical protein